VLNLPVYRWGQPYESLEVADVVHFQTGESVAKVSQANGGIISRDMKKADAARGALRELSPDEILIACEKAAELFATATLPMGDGQQSPDEFVCLQSASTGMPQNMCRANMGKIQLVLSQLRQITDALTRGLDLEILRRGYGIEDRGVIVSYQAQTPVLGAVLPSNSPGVHTLWLPAVPLQVGLALKPGGSEPWTPYRIASSLWEAGIPREAIGLYPGGHDAGPAILNACARSMIFGSQETVERYRGDPRVSVHGPGFSKILFGDDVVDDWESHLDMMVESVLSNGGRSCINCSGIWASRHTREIADALADRIGPIDVAEPTDPTAQLAAFTQPSVATAVWNAVENDLKAAGTDHRTARFGPRLVDHERCSYLRPTVVHCDSPEPEVARKETMFPFATVVKCEPSQMLRHIGPTLVGTALTDDQEFIQKLSDSTDIDRLNIGPIPTNRLNWLQPHEGNIIDFLYRSRAYQLSEDRVVAHT
jgi:acyl-CoA reductase-like NAD-dependent aldehyde dehydrogenase